MERNMDESRMQFEEWRMSDSPNSNLYRDTYGEYAEIGTWVAWKAWQASRAAIEIELPAKIDREAYDTDFDDGCRWGHNDAISACSGRIRAAGIKVKE